MRAAVIDFVMIGLASCAQPQPEVAASPEDVDNARRAAQMLGSRLQTD